MRAQMIGDGVMAKSRTYEQEWLSGARNPSTLAWIVAVFAVGVQYGSFMYINKMGPDGKDLPDLIQDPVNTVCIAASLASIVIASSFVYRDIEQLLARNMRYSCLYFSCCDIGGVVNPS